MNNSNKNDISERIRLIMNHFGLNQSEFAKRIGIKQPNLSGILKGERPCGEGVINKIILSFDISKQWLMTGEGEMLNSAADDGPAIDAPSFLVPLINIDSVGGIHSRNQLTTTEQFPVGLVPFPDARPDDRAIYQSGDSMSPTIPPGAILQLRKVEDWQDYIGYGNVYVLWLNDDRRITKLIRRFDPDPRNFVLCCSYNPAHDDEELPRSFIREVWKVINTLVPNGW